MTMTTMITDNDNNNDNDNPLSDGVRDTYEGIQALGLLIVLNVHRISDFEGAATVPGTLRRHSHKPALPQASEFAFVMFTQVNGVNKVKSSHGW
eukprot:CAMPEP_0167816876 /NCGR_PEP_ID=MMETSP0112_2-20121227/3867_1 /TAXON_ID=91324 /ORGANISM="Lotharella globosa, Strain CCCM811" /LENGTH=93 /DNA_ID=CAMNT_0007716547 /DNA_START=53 /DNA_END=331 /DNA_ORIENTATION=-